MTALARYRPSGSFGIATLPLALGAAVAGALLAFLYTKLIDWIPFVQLDFLIVIAFGFALGALAWQAVQVGHCRSWILGAFAGLLIAAVAIAASYFWSYDQVVRTIHSEHPDFTHAQIMQNYTFQRWLDSRLAHGWKLSDEKDPVSGGMVIAIWIVEGLCLLGAGVFGGFGAARHVYCERCGRWTVDRTLLLQGYGKESAQPFLDAGDLNGLIALPALPSDKQPKRAATTKDPLLALNLTGSICPKCRENGWLTVKEMRTVITKKANTSAKSLASRAALDPGQTARFLERVPKLPIAAN